MQYKSFRYMDSRPFQKEMPVTLYLLRQIRQQVKTPPLPKSPLPKCPHFSPTPPSKRPTFSKINHYKENIFVIQMFINVFPRFVFVQIFCFCFILSLLIYLLKL